MSGEVDTTTGVKEEIVNSSGVIDAGESGTVTDGLAMERLDAGTVQIWTGTGRYCGLARIIRGTSAGVASAVAGEKIALVRKGVQIAVDSKDDTLKLGQPVKPTGTAGALRLWVGGTDYVDALVGYVERLKDANDKILVSMRGVGGA